MTGNDFDNYADRSESQITRKRLSDEVASRIRDAILTGRLKPGMRVVQEEWAQRLGVSRMPVRDAVVKLASEGLVNVSTSSETTVASLTEEDVEDAYLLNAVVTGMAAQRSARRITDDGIEELQRIHDEMRAAVERDDVSEAERLNWLFHRVLNVSCGSSRLIAFMRTLSGGIPHFAVREIPEWRSQALAEHEEILAALRERDAERSKELMERHVFAARDLVLEHLRCQGFWLMDEEEDDGSPSPTGPAPSDGPAVDRTRARRPAPAPKEA